MKKHRFFFPEADFVEKHETEKHQFYFPNLAIFKQMKDVLRLHAGDSIVILNNTGKEFHGKIISLSSDELVLSKESLKENSNIPKVKIWLYASMLKKDKYEWVLQKCTEIGVSEFHPIISERTEKINLNFDRAENIIREASEQSEQSLLPKLFETISLEKALKEIFEIESDKNKITFALHMDGEKFETIREKIQKEISAEKNNSEISPKKSVAVFIGPEGGWGEKDLELFKKYDVPLVSLGDSVLRGETASVVVSGLFLL